MKLSSIRTLEELRPALADPKATGPDPVYWVFSEITTGGKWDNLTVVAPGRIGKEFPKTFGHYHHRQVPEIYHRVEGNGVLQLQKKHLENDRWIPEMVDEVLLVTFKSGDELAILPEYGHSWSNVGNGPLVLYDNWEAGHTPSDYEMIKNLSGLAYYLIEENGKIKAIPNPRYKNLPEPIWLPAEEFKTYHHHNVVP